MIDAAAAAAAVGGLRALARLSSSQELGFIAVFFARREHTYVRYMLRKKVGNVTCWVEKLVGGGSHIFFC